jgi:hypothetical protein
VQLNVGLCLFEVRQAVNNHADVKDEIDIVKHAQETVIDVEEQTNRDSNSARLNKRNV